MIYLISNNKELFTNDLYTQIDVQQALDILNLWPVIQFDSETSGRDPHITDFLCVQFGNKQANIQIVVDTTTIDIQLFKNILESKLLIVHNGKFDLQFCYKHNIIPTKIWDTMIVEQVLHLGYSKKTFHVSLKDVALRRLNINIDKTVRGEIIWRGLDTSVIVYAAGDVMYLEDIKEQQEQECQQKDCLTAAKLENAFVPVIAYLEWCGIKLDVEKWQEKINNNQKLLKESEDYLNNWVINNTNPLINQFVFQELQYDLFSNTLPDPICTIKWSSSQQVLQLFKLLGFNTITTDKKTGEEKNSVVENLLSTQRGICDELLDAYFKYKAAEKECSTYGQNYLNSINPITGRIHTTFWQLGTNSGRMSCGSNQENTDLVKLTQKKAIYPQLQNLPADELTRSCFISEQGNLFTSADFSALESRLGADIYNEPEMLKEYIDGSGDIHSLTAKICFPNELKNIDVKDIKKLRPDLRKKAKGPEFACQFGGGAKAISSTLGISYEEAKTIEAAYKQGFKGITSFKEKGSQFVRNNGYVLMCNYTGHKMYWEDFQKWREIENISYIERKQSLSSDELKEHQMAGAKWDRMALNAPTQGTGAAIIKLSGIYLFRWILKNNLFNTVKLCNMVHDEICVEYPENLKDQVVLALKKSMEQAAAKLCKKLPIPAEAETGTYWIH